MRSRTGRSYNVAVGAHGPRARPAAPGQVGERRRADLPALVRPWRVRLGRDDDQRPQPAGVQDPRRPARAQDLRRAAARLPGDQGSGRRHGRVLRQVPQRDALPGRRDRAARRTRSATSRRPTASATTTPPSASCAPRAPARARRSGRRSDYVGPAAIVNAHRFIFDSRDDAADERLEILADQDGVWRCRTIFNCVDACPRGINITRAILEVSGATVEQPGLTEPLARSDPHRRCVARQSRTGRRGRR